LPSAERVAQKKDENAPASPVVLQRSDKEAEEDVVEDIVVTSKVETSSLSESGSSSSNDSFFLQARNVSCSFSPF
jgi:hypothetical protein